MFICNKNTFCSLFPAFLLTSPSIFFLLCLPVFQWCFHPPPHLPLWLQRSCWNSGVCRCMLAVGLKTVHNYVIHRNLGETRVRRHRSKEREKVRWGTCNAAMHLSTLAIHTQTHTHTPPHFSAATMQAQQHTNAHRQVVKAHSINGPKPSQAVSEQKHKRVLRRKEYLALPSGVRGLEEKSQTERDREKSWKHLHTNTTVVLSLCMLCMAANHGYHTKGKAFPSASESFLLGQTHD